MLHGNSECRIISCIRRLCSEYATIATRELVSSLYVIAFFFATQLAELVV